MKYSLLLLFLITSQLYTQDTAFDRRALEVCTAAETRLVTLEMELIAVRKQIKQHGIQNINTDTLNYDINLMHNYFIIVKSEMDSTKNLPLSNSPRSPEQIQYLHYFLQFMCYIL